MILQDHARSSSKLNHFLVAEHRHELLSNIAPQREQSAEWRTLCGRGGVSGAANHREFDVPSSAFLASADTCRAHRLEQFRFCWRHGDLHGLSEHTS